MSVLFQVNLMVLLLSHVENQASLFRKQEVC
jgi:hypothetical protein